MAENKSCCCGDKLPGKIREAVCINTNRVYDSCADKDCLADLRVYFPPQSQGIIDHAINARCKGTKVLNVFIDVEKVPYNNGCYACDIIYFFKVEVEVYCAPPSMPVTLCGFASFSKKCILYGSEGRVKVFSSEYSANENDDQLMPTNTNPRAKVQVADPICLDAKICRQCDCCNTMNDVGISLPKCIKRCFDEDFPEDFHCRPCEKVVAVTIGLFSIVQLERDVQMLIPAYDFCIPNKECACETDDPCEAFRKIKFPVDEFFPPNAENICNDSCGCSCCD